MTSVKKGRKKEVLLELSDNLESILKTFSEFIPSERETIAKVNYDQFSNKCEMQIDCIGCINQLHDHLKDLASKASSSKEKFILTDTFKIFPNKCLTLKNKFVENPENVVKLLHFLEIQKKDYQKINDKIGFAKKSQQNGGKKYQHRCILHSNKEISSIWKDEIVTIVSNELEDIDKIGEIDEGYF